MPKSTSTSFWDHPITTLEEALSLRKQIERLQGQLGRTLGSTTTAISRVVRGKRKKTMSPQARAKIAAAARARWAKLKRQGSKTTRKAAKGAAKTASKAIKTQKAAPRKKGRLTPEGRAKLAAAMRARWAARKKGAPAPNAAK